MNLDELVEEFAKCVRAQSDAIANSDPVTGNKFAARYIAAFEELRAYGNTGRDALAILLDDGRPDVKVMAAALLLRHCEERAKAVLEAEAKGTGLVAFGAEQALKRWEEGSWTLDPQ